MSRRNTWLIIGGLVIIVLIGIAGYLQQPFLPSAAPQTGVSTPTPAASGVVIIPLSSESREYPQSGIATLTEVNGQVKVDINISQADGLNDQPAHIHMGGCPGVEAVVYPLNNVVNGKSETVIDTTLDRLRIGLPLAINIHKSAQEINTYTSCGDIRL